MAERRYSFRFSLPEGCVLFLGLLLTSFLVFLFGVYVGKEVEAHKNAQQTRTVRLPIAASAEPPASSPPIAAPAVPTLLSGGNPSRVPSIPSSAPASPVAGQRDAVASTGEVSTPRGSLPSPSPAPPVGQNKPALSLSPSPVAPAPVVSKPPPSLPPSPTATGAAAPKPSSSSPPSPATTAIAPKSSSVSLSTAATSSAVAPLTSPATPSKPSPTVPVGSEFSPLRAPSAVGPGSVAKEKKSVSSSGHWAVQVQATTQEEAAQNTAKLLRDQGLTPVVSRIERQGEVWYRVRVGKFANEEEAKAVVSRFRREGKFSQAYPVLE